MRDNHEDFRAPERRKRSVFRTFLLFLKTSLVTVLLMGLGFVGWKAYRFYYGHGEAIAERDRRIAEQSAEIQQLEGRVERLDLALQLLKVDHRLGRIVVLSNNRNEVAESPEEIRTRFQFIELGPDGQPLTLPKEFEIVGDVLYVDAFVVKFEDVFVERGDPLRSASLCLFRRLFGEHQKPVDGFVLDEPGRRPTVYGKGEQTSLESEVWAKFWNYANSPQKAKKLGIRAAHGEAPSMKLVQGRTYFLTLRASGGLTIRPER